MKVVLNGCFDSFHDGHKHILYKAWEFAHGGTVYILVNDDKSVKQLKRTPTVSERQRCETIIKYCNLKQTAHDFTNFHVFRFGTEEELLRLIEDINPDMIIKGNDRPDVRDIVGSDRWPVCIVPRLKDKDGDISTTRQLNG